MQIHELAKGGHVGVQNLTEKSWFSPASTEEQIEGKVEQWLGVGWGA